MSQRVESNQMNKNEQVEFVTRAMESLPDSRVEAIYHSASLQVQFDQLERDTKKCCEILNDCAKAVQS